MTSSRTFILTQNTRPFFEAFPSYARCCGCGGCGCCCRPVCSHRVFFCGKIIPLNDKNEFFICTPPEKELDKGGWVRKKAKNNPCPSFHSIDPLKWNNMRDTWDVMIPLPGCQSLTGWHDMTSNEVGDHIYVYGTNNCIVEKHQNPDILYIRYADTWYM